MSDSDSDDELFNEREEEEEEEVVRGTFQTHGSGLIGGIAGEVSTFYVVFNKQDIDLRKTASELVSILLRPKVNRMKYIGRTTEVPEVLECSLTVLPPPSFSSPNVTVKVSYISTFAALYQVNVEAHFVSRQLPDIRIQSRNSFFLFIYSYYRGKGRVINREINKIKRGNRRDGLYSQRSGY